jgi:acetyl esterase/lipase
MMIRKQNAGEKYLFLAALSIFILVSSCAGSKKPAGIGPHEDFGAKAEIVKKDIPYAQGVPGAGKLKLDVYSNPHSGLWPVIVMIHGGAWTKGSKEMDNKIYLCQVLAKNGYVVFNIDYRLAPAYPIKDQIEDSLAAVIWAKEHAREYGGDPSRVGVAGGSAGGHLSAVVAWNGSDPYFHPTGHPEKEPDTKVKAAALYYPVIDLNRTLKDLADGFSWLGELIFTGSVGKAYRDQLPHISPVNYIKKDDPPTIFLTGDADNLKLYPQSVESVKKLKDLGVDAELFSAPGKKHGFTWDYWDPVSVASGQAMVKFFDKYLKD